MVLETYKQPDQIHTNQHLRGIDPRNFNYANIIVSFCYFGRGHLLAADRLGAGKSVPVIKTERM